MSFANINRRYSTDLDCFEPEEGTPLVDAKPSLVIPVEQDVYSAILFLPAISRINTGVEYSRNARLALALCILNAVMQIGVVQVVNVYNHDHRREALQTLIFRDELTHAGGNSMKEKQKQYEDTQYSAIEKMHIWLLPKHEKEQFDEVSLIKPLCARTVDANDTGHFTCMPHSSQYTQEWDNLDSDGDGMWTLQEAKNDTAGLRKKYGVNPETVFYNAIDGFRMHASDMMHTNRSLFLSKDVDSGVAIPKAYFNYWVGDAMLCSLFDQTSCEVAAKKGLFAEALRPGRMSGEIKGIYDLDTALRYCHKMLKRNGGCETIMPLDWKRTRDQRKDRCGRRDQLDEGVQYVNPFDANQAVSVMKRRFQSVERAQDSGSPLFLMFLTLIIMLWLLSLIGEWRYILKFTEFILVFPGLSDRENHTESSRGGHMNTVTPRDGDPEDADSKYYHVTGLSHAHRAVLIVVFVLRVGVAFVLTQFGVQFLVVEQNYLNLVLNSLALTFILSIDNMLFEMVEISTKKEMDCCKDVEFATRMPQKGYLGYSLKKECWGMFLVPLLSVLIVAQCAYQYKFPILAALKCACGQEGPQCIDTMENQVGWWDRYWSHTLPATMHQIESMRLSGA